MKKPKYQFKAGSVKQEDRFIRTIICSKETPDNKWERHFLLVNIESYYPDSNTAAAIAKSDLEIAHKKVYETKSDTAMAEHLSSLGYCKLEKELD